MPCSVLQALWLHVYLLLAELCLPSCTLLTDHSTMTCTNTLTALCTDLAVRVKYTDRWLTVFFISNRPIFSETSLKWQRSQQWECDTFIPLNSAFRNSHTLSMAMLCPMPPRRLTVRLWIASSAKDEAHQPEIPEQTVNVFFRSVKAKVHYASWSETCSKPAGDVRASWSQTCVIVRVVSRAQSPPC